jgi:phosphatidylserine/phosphatidylglycerophosphate/cardiolipin synthase-like enzyme
VQRRKVIEERSRKELATRKRSTSGHKQIWIESASVFYALENSTSHLLINSPWITRSVVNAEFIKKLQRLLQRGVRVYISWGLGDESEEKTDKGALKAIQRPMQNHKNLWLSRFGDTHAKVLLSDRRYVIVTSFNWLFFRGDPNRTFRDEQGTLVRIPELIDEKSAFFRKRFEEER